MHVFTAGASKSLVIEYLLTLNKTKPKQKTLNLTFLILFFFFFFSCQMQPVDLLGITIKTLAEIEKEVGSQPGTKQKHHESCVHFIVRSLPLWKMPLLSFPSHCRWIKSTRGQRVSSELGMSSVICAG